MIKVIMYFLPFTTAAAVVVHGTLRGGDVSRKEMKAPFVY